MLIYFLLFLLFFDRPGHGGLPHLKRTNIAERYPDSEYIMPPYLDMCCVLYAENAWNSRISTVFLYVGSLIFAGRISHKTRSSRFDIGWVCSIVPNNSVDLLSDLDPFCYRGTECEFKFHRILRVSSLEGLSGVVQKPQERFGITVKETRC